MFNHSILGEIMKEHLRPATSTASALMLVLAGALALFQAGSVTAAEVGVSVQISQPGVYGRIDIGRFPQPQLVVTQPVLIVRPAVAYQPPQPVYMWVPPGHRKNWRRHCREYNACGVPVYFVQHRWYDDHVRKGQGGKGDDWHDDKGKDKGKDKDKGKGKGKGKDKDKGKHGD